MITNPEYIKMILALPNDFFEDWEWRTGDKAVKILNNEIVVFLWKAEEHAWYYNYHPSFSNEMSSAIKLCDIRPLPSQEQLQNKIIKSQNCKPSDVFNLFQTWYYIYSHQKDNTGFNSFKEAWLHCYMWLEKKEWNGEKWV